MKLEAARPRRSKAKRAGCTSRPRRGMRKGDAGIMLHRLSSPRPAAAKAQGLDLLEAAHRDRVYPLIFCHIVCEGVPDAPRLRRAIRLLGGYIPEISAAYDFSRGVFVDKGLGPDALIAEGQDPGGDGAWDLGAGPQLKIGLRREAGGSSVLIGMSHILSDGAGFLQVLYLLAALYNGDCEPVSGENERDIGAVLRAAPVRVGIWGRRRTGTGRTPRPPRLCLPGEGELSDCLSVSLAPDALEALRQAAKRCAATLNDVFLTAYARAAARVWRTDRIALPCPADLRRFRGGPAELTVANMTGLYRLDLDGLQSSSPLPRRSGGSTPKWPGKNPGGAALAGFRFCTMPRRCFRWRRWNSCAKRTIPSRRSATPTWG